MVKRLYKKAKSVLFADPRFLFEEERALINQAFYFSGTNGKAVLLIHGWTSVPYEVRRLGKYLNENGYTTYGPMLKGHGTMPRDLENVRWQEWLEDVKKSYLKLRENHEKVYLAGTSMGASLAVMLAKDHPEISGLVLMAMPYKIKMEKAIRFLAKLNLYFRKYNRKYYPPTFGARTTITRLISYQTYPIASTLETIDLFCETRKHLKNINQPCFIIQSSSDHIVTRGSAKDIYRKINSRIKKLKYIKRAYHTFISDIKNESVFEDILNFMEEN